VREGGGWSSCKKAFAAASPSIDTSLLSCAREDEVSMLGLRVSMSCGVCIFEFQCRNQHQRLSLEQSGGVNREFIESRNSAVFPRVGSCPLFF
jgi:hypothetical protein